MRALHGPLPWVWRWLLALAGVLLLALAGARTVQAQTVSTCSPATQGGTAPADFRDYCWLNFAGYNDSAARNGGQLFRFDLPDGTRISLTVRVNDVSPSYGTAINAVPVPSWSGAAFGNTAFLGIAGRPVLYNAQSGGSARITLDDIVVTAPTGGRPNYAIIVADGESTNSGESLVISTDGNDWQRVDSIRNGSSNIFPDENFSNSSQTVTVSGVGGTVGSYVYRSDGNPEHIWATLNGGGLQGVIFGVRYASVSAVSQFSGGRYSPSDQFEYSLRTGSGAALVTGATSGTALDGFAPAVLPTVAASYPFQVVQTMAPGSVGTAANYTTTLTCVNANAGSSTKMPVNEPVTSYTFLSLRYRDSVTCTFTNTPQAGSVGGTVYADANRNGSQDGGETGTGASGLYVKLVPSSGGSCTAAAQQAAAVNPTTGAYQLPGVPAGNYCLVLDTNATLSDVTPTLPAGWLGLQNGTGRVSISVATGSPEPPQDFGLFNGSRLTGSVFADTGSGSGGIANDGVRQAVEAGLGGITVSATAGASTMASAVTAGDGSFTLWLPAGTGALTVGPTPLPTGSIATGGSAGSTGGSFTRPNLVFTPVPGQTYSGVAIGLVPTIRLAPNGAQTAAAGTAVFYPHTFAAGSGGQVAFSLAGSSVPALSGWTAVLYRDSNCSATLEGSEPVLSGALTVAAGEEVCLIAKQFVPAGAPSSAQNTLTVTAQFTFTNASPALAIATAAVTDVTTVGEPAALVLHKRVSNVTRGGAPATSVNATPGDVLLYVLKAQNQGSAPLTTLAIHDTTAAFTTFVSAACPGALPAGITCSVSSQPAAGAAGGLRWTFTGALAPGAELSVSYQVRLDQ
jgi:uncharacterized repeat protein (TIGR01451 family)